MTWSPLPAGRQLRVLARVFSLATLVCGFLLVGPPATAELPPYLRILEEDSTGVTLAVEIPLTSFDVSRTGDGSRKLRVGRLPLSLRPGQPELPVLIASVALPDTGSFEIAYEAGEEVALPGAPVQAVAEPGPDGRLKREPDPSIYGPEGAIWPGERVEVREVRYRELRALKLTIHPARYAPATRELLLTPSFEIRVDFENGQTLARGDRLDDTEKRLAGRALVNGKSVLARGKPLAAPEAATRPATAGRTARGVANAGVRIRVDREGIYRVTRADLVAIGFDPTGVDPRNLEVSYRGTPVPCRVTGEDDASFDAGDAVEFYGIPVKTRFNDDSRYWLEERTVPGLRHSTRGVAPGGAAVATSFPHTEHYEEGNGVYTFGKPAQDGDPHFYWAWFQESGADPRIQELEHSASLPGLLNTEPEATFRALFHGRTNTADNPDHHARVSVNGTVIGDIKWDGQTFHLPNVGFDPALLVGGNNDFKIEFVVITSVDIYYMDWFEIVYPRAPEAAADALIVVGEGATPLRYDISGFSSAHVLALDVTDPFAPVELTGGTTVSRGDPFTFSFEESAPAGKRFALAGPAGPLTPVSIEMDDNPSDLRNPANGADEIIVVPDGWEADLQALVAHRQAQGDRVVLVTLTDVADEFASGNVDDVAIRDFVAHAYANWQDPPVKRLLLVGKSNLDPKNYFEEPTFHHYMPTHFSVTVVQGETATDNYFGAVAGPDQLPDVAVARFSVRSGAEAAQLASKVINYENNPPNGAAWASNVVHIASDETPFEESLENAASWLPPHFTVEEEYRDSGASAGSISDAFDNGAVIASFVGHGNVDFWADGGSGPFYDNDDVAGLNNADGLPFVTALNCLNGLVAHPLYVVMAEQFHNMPDDGALAMWAPASLGFLGEYDIVQAVLYKTIFEDHVPQVGDAVVSALVESFLTTPISFDVITELILLADPGGWLAIDSDDDALLDHAERAAGLDAGDRDSDDDGWLDGQETAPGADTDGDGLVNGLDPDSDNDGLPDGLEAGIDTADPDTDTAKGFFRPDLDTGSSTDPLNPDSDGGGAPDGVEDLDADGSVQPPETDPENPADDIPCSSDTPPEIAGPQPNKLVNGNFEDWINPTTPVDWRVDLGNPGVDFVIQTTDPEHVHGGLSAIELHRDATSIGTTLQFHKVTREFSLQPGRLYRMALWAKADHELDTAVSFIIQNRSEGAKKFLHPDGTWVSSSQTLLNASVGTEYTHFTLDFVVDPAHTHPDDYSIGVKHGDFFAEGGTSDLYYDDLSIDGPFPNENEMVVNRAGDDLVIEWGDASSEIPCILYRVYVADGALDSNGLADFRLLAVTPHATYTHPGAWADGISHRYLILGSTLAGGEGPSGHF